MNKSLFHSLEGENITFKALSIDDVKEIHNYASDKEVSRFIGWDLMNTLNETREHIEIMLKRESTGTHLYASIVVKSTQAIVGTAMIFNFDQEANHAEIGYVFHKDHWGKGYGTESVALMSDFAFKSLNLHKLHASVVDTNIGSARILEKNKYELEGRLKDHYYIEDKYYDALLFGKITNLQSRKI
ncbi:GNAT family N-acetyltransferase [Neobacillus pocheonensis]|uniref:GNAT family N-acetyltransferase n=1 Tax=Neobacillus pocheonensis TaxID=363869 RepID=A0ABT0WIW0_9BACI|nr:GNAT family N-acetyltransferase [Neobacillus pocheonensis]